MSGRTRLLAAAVALVAVVAGAVAVAYFVFDVGRSDGDAAARSVEIDEAEGRRRARAACSDFDRFVSLVQADASGDDVFEVLGSAEDAARDAANADPRWIDLSGGMSGLEVGFREDDPEASRLSLSVVRTACERLP